MRAALLVLLAGCVDVASVHRCSVDDDCVRSGITGRCEPAGNCSFADSLCGDGAYRYDVHAGPRAGICVVRLEGPTLLDTIDFGDATDDTKASCAVDGARNAYVELDSPMPQILAIDTQARVQLALREGSCGDTGAMELACQGQACEPLPYSRLITPVGTGRYCLVIEEAEPTSTAAKIVLRVLPARRGGAMIDGTSGTVSGDTCSQPAVAQQCGPPNATTAAFLAPLCPNRQLTGTVTPNGFDAIVTTRRGLPDDVATNQCFGTSFAAPAQPELVWIMVSSTTTCGTFSLAYSYAPPSG